MVPIVVGVVAVLVAVVVVVIVLSKRGNTSDEGLVIDSASRIAELGGGGTKPTSSTPPKSLSERVATKAPSAPDTPDTEPAPDVAAARGADEAGEGTRDRTETPGTAAEDRSPRPSVETPDPQNAPDDPDEIDDDGFDLSRFGVATKKKPVEIPWPSPSGVTPSARHLEGTVAPDVGAEGAPTDSADEFPAPQSGDATGSDREDQPAEAAAEVSEPDVEDQPAETGTEDAVPSVDLSTAEADAEEPDEIPVAHLEEDDDASPMDLVVNALIQRASERQVGVAQVAAELVERADLEDREVDEVLLDLVETDNGDVRADDRISELTLFNNEVPRRPGELTQFSELTGADKKRVIVRVLCLLVATAEDNKLAPQSPRSDAERRQWPLARAVWPVATTEDEGDKDDPDLPARGFAASRR
ncbi:MAG: hypothetical protein JJU45_10525 [Acidimicrobiia bacterium]|nr:hypothetical protein [Acidimicrobiia bacterium]